MCVAILCVLMLTVDSGDLQIDILYYYYLAAVRDRRKK